VPCLKLRHEILLPSSLEKMRKPDLVAVMDLAFDYQGVLVWTGERPAIERDVAGERHARFLVERLGAVEVDCVDGLAGRLVTDADYVLGADGDAQDVCGFITQALPRLRELGFRVEVVKQIHEQDCYSRLGPAGGELGGRGGVAPGPVAVGPHLEHHAAIPAPGQVVIPAEFLHESRHSFRCCFTR